MYHNSNMLNKQMVYMQNFIIFHNVADTCPYGVGGWLGVGGVILGVCVGGGVRS